MKHWLIAGVAASALLAACGGGGNGGEEGVDAEVREAAKIGDISLPTLTLRSGDAAEAGDALAAMFLEEGTESRVSFGARDIDGANATFTDVEILVEEGDVPIKAGNLSFAGLEMTDAGPSFSQMTLSDISVQPDGEEEGTLLVNQIQLTNPSPELAGFVAALFGETPPESPPDFTSLAFDGFSLSGFSVDAEEIDELEEFSIGSIDLRGMGPEALQAMVVENIALKARDEADNMDVSMSLGSVSVSGLGMGLLDALSEQDVSDPDGLAEAIMQMGISNPGDPGYDTVLLDAMNINVGGVGIDLPSMEAGVTRNGAGQAVRAVTTPFDMIISADPEGELGSQFAGQLGLLGYEELKFTAAQDVTIDPDTDTVSSDAATNYLELADGFRLAGGGAFSGFTEYNRRLSELAFADGGEPNPDDILGAVSALSLQSFELQLVDNSMMERVFTAVAAQTGDTPENVKGQAQLSLGFLPLMAGQAGIDPEILTELSGALGSFLSEPGTLTLKLDPEAPIDASTFSDPSEITKAALGFSASAE